MAYRKRYNRTKKRAYRKKRGTGGYLKTGIKVAKTAAKALHMAYRLKDMVNTEYKEFEEGIFWQNIGDGTNNPTVSNSIVAYPLCLPPQGIEFDNMIGDSIKLQRLTLRGHIAWKDQAIPTSGRQSAAVRVILFRGHACEGKMWPTTVATVGGEPPFLDQKGIFGAKTDDNKYNSKILMDRVYQLDVAKRNIIQLKWNFPLNWHQNMSTTNNADIVQNGLYLIVLSDTGVTALTEFKCNYCVTFTDN